MDEAWGMCPHQVPAPQCPLCFSDAERAERPGGLRGRLVPWLVTAVVFVWFGLLLVVLDL